MLTDFSLVFCCSCCLLSGCLLLPVVQPCQVDLDLTWLDVNRICACVSLQLLFTFRVFIATGRTASPSCVGPGMARW